MFSEEEKRILSNYVTNVEGNVFALKNLPEVVKGALFSRYSRSSKSLKRLLLDEFINSEISLIKKPEKNIEEIDEKKAEEFYDRVLIGFGDDSVAELAFAHVALENVSMIAAKALEDSRIGISPLEKSTRYVYFDKKLNGKYLYYEEPTIMESNLSSDYTYYMNKLFDLYSKLIPSVRKYIESKFPRDPGISERAYKATIRAKTCDLLRGLLPASTLTNLGLAGNGRSFEYLIIKLRASPLKELNILAGNIHEELSKIIPSFVKRSFSKHGDSWVEFLRKEAKLLSSYSLETRESSPLVKLIDVEGDELQVIAALLYEYSHAPFEKLLSYVKELKREERESLLEDLLSLRVNRRHKPPRAFEFITFKFEVTTNFGAYRDLQRHRILTQMRQPLGISLGYDVPRELIEGGFEEDYREGVESIASLYEELSSRDKFLAQYVVPMSYRVRWLVSMNLREAFHLCELRSSPQGHDDYRKVAIQMYDIIKEIFPVLGDMKFVSKENVELNRLEAERRLDKKIEEIKRKYNL